MKQTSKYLLLLLLSLGCSSESESGSRGNSVSVEPTGKASQASEEFRVPEIDLSGFEEFSAEQITQALKELQRASPEDRPRAWADLGMICHSFEFYEVSLLCYQHTAAALPQDFRWPYLIGRIHEVEGQSATAMDAYQQALNIAGQKCTPAQRVAILCRIGDLRIENNELGPARQQFEQAHHIAPEDAWPLFCLGRIAARNKELDKAADYLRRAHEAHPDASNVSYLLGTVLRRQKNLHEAEQLIRSSVSQKTNLAARDPLMESVRVLASGARRLIDDGNRLFRAGRFQEAQTAFREAVTADPDNARALCNLGSAQERLGDADAAEQSYLAATDADPDFLMAHFNLGVLAARRGDDLNAVSHYGEVLRRDSLHRDALFNRANANVRLGRQVEAVADLDVVITGDPGNLNARLAKARALVLNHQYADAADSLRKAVTVAPDNLMIRHDLARLLVAAPTAEVRNGEEGLRLANEVFAAQSWVAHAETLAMALAEMKRFEEAVELQKSAMQAATGEGRLDLAEAMQQNLDLYLKRKPCRNPWHRHQLVPAATATHATAGAEARSRQ